MKSNKNILSKGTCFRDKINLSKPSLLLRQSALAVLLQTEAFGKTLLCLSTSFFSPPFESRLLLFWESVLGSENASLSPTLFSL